jgi:uncharacterized membrane protein
MIKALKVVLIVYAVLGILIGIMMTFAPEQLPAMRSYEKGSEYMFFFLSMLGITIIVSSIFFIIASRDPLRNILWVQFALVTTILMVAVNVYSIVLDYVSFGDAGVGLIIDCIFAVAFLFLYPWRAVRAQ